MALTGLGRAYAWRKPRHRTAKVLATGALTESFDAGAPLDASPDAGNLGIVSNAIYGIAVDGTYVHWTDASTTAGRIPKTPTP